MHFGRNFPWAQVYAPAGKPFVALEPMAAPTDALTTGAENDRRRREIMIAAAR